MDILYAYYIKLIVNYYFITSTELLDVPLNDDPSSWPGHMEPLGVKQRKEEIKTLLAYPSPEDFFSQYVNPGNPFLLKDGGKNQPAYKHWSDDYILGYPEAKTELIGVEPNLVENRDAKGFSTSLKKFIDTYHNQSIYMVNPVPSFLMKDILIPAPLRCKSAQELMTNHLMWMSSGGTKSVLHSDDVDNINCVFKGSKDVLLIDPNKFDGMVPIDKPHGGYSSVDVEKVNFTKYPSLRNVEYIKGHMEEGDCLFIPYRWYHQINSIANKDKQNIAVNIWFKHQPDHIPKDCEIPDEKMSLDNSIFDGDIYSPDEESDDAEDDKEFPLIGLFNFTLSETKHKRANLKTFHAILHNLPGIFNESPIDHLTLTEEFKKLGTELFNKLNAKKDKYIDEGDIKQILYDFKLADEVENWLQTHMDKMSNIVAEQLAEEAKLYRESKSLNTGNISEDPETTTRDEL